MAPDIDLSSGAHIRVLVPTVIATTVPLPSIPHVAVLPISGPPGEPGAAGEGASPDLPDLCLLFDNALL